MNKGTIEFDLSTPEGRESMELCLNSRNLKSALFRIREILYKDHEEANKLKGIIWNEFEEVDHLLDL
mgnify:CR=1 FL=1